MAFWLQVPAAVKSFFLLLVINAIMKSPFWDRTVTTGPVRSIAAKAHTTYTLIMTIGVGIGTSAVAATVRLYGLFAHSQNYSVNRGQSGRMTGHSSSTSRSVSITQRMMTICEIYHQEIL